MADEVQQFAVTTTDEEDEDYSDFAVASTTPIPRAGQLTRALIRLIELMQRSCSNKLLRALNLTEALDESSTFILPPANEDNGLPSFVIPSGVKRSQPLYSVPQRTSASSSEIVAMNSAAGDPSNIAAAAAGAQYNHERTVQLINNVTKHIARTLNLNTTSCADEADACVKSLRQLETAARNVNGTAFDPNMGPRLAGDDDDGQGFYYRGGSNGRSDKLADQVVTNSIIQVVVLVIVITILLVLTGKMLMDLGSRTGYPAHGGPGARA